LDYQHPVHGFVSLALIRHRATDQARRIGSLFFNPGGPGGSGVASLPGVTPYFTPQVRARFDLVSWDPRGIGQSTSIQCFPSQADEAAFLAQVPAIPVGESQQRQLVARNIVFGRNCAQRAGALLEHVSTADSATDLDLLRAAVGDRKLTYYGVSYGTFLGATYTNMFPNRVRAVVLDGTLSPTAWMSWRPTAEGRRLGTFLRVQSDNGANATVNAFLASCGRLSTQQCAFSAGTPAGTRAKFAALVSQLRSHSLQPRGGYTYATFLDAVINGTYFLAQWPRLATTMQNVWLNQLSSTAKPPAQKYFSLGQQLAVVCGESPNPPAATFPWQSVFATNRSGATAPYWAWTTEACATWPATATHRYAGPWNRPTAAPVLVINTTHDPATPYQDAVQTARLLARARLLTVTGYGHTELLNPSTCANRQSSRYLIAGTLPPVGTTCPQDAAPFS
jgi:pimeloyl-ACP methyl ester carboxylesterase